MDIQTPSTHHLLDKPDLSESRDPNETENKTIYSTPSETTFQNNIQKRDILQKMRDQKRILLADLCELSGGGGRFQKIILLLLFIIFLFTGFFSNLRIYSFEKPIFLCLLINETLFTIQMQFLNSIFSFRNKSMFLNFLKHVVNYILYKYWLLNITTSVKKA